jgi:hypothetical protein
MSSTFERVMKRIKKLTIDEERIIRHNKLELVK